MSFRSPGTIGLRPIAGPIDALQFEVLQEKASTLGRVTQAFEAALTALRDFDAGSEAEAHAGAPDDRRRETFVDVAAEALWYFVIQREACGLRNTEAVLREYRVPAAVRLRMGATRRG